jgi:NAD(P)-dependent dehydrogenase (short-subunit alcohol dehydrogenase family)
MSEKWTEADVADQTAKTVLVTGANSGLGLETARALAQNGANVVMACRNTEKAAAAKALIDETDPAGETDLLEMDLGNLDSIRSGVEVFLESHQRLDVLVNNAGIMWTPKGLTADGFEQQLGVNHLGHFALTGLLLEVLLESGPARVVTISSNGHKAGKIDLDDLQSEESYSPYGAYFQSKLANLLFMCELQRRFAAANSEAISVAAHPGGSDTNLGHENPGGIAGTLFEKSRPIMDRFFSQSAQQGALPTLLAATGPDVVGGDYYGPDGFMELKGAPTKVDMTKRAKDEAVARRLWQKSVELTGVTYEW